MNSPFFSTIVPTHNGAEHIRKDLDSVKQQRFDDYELKRVNRHARRTAQNGANWLVWTRGRGKYHLNSWAP